MKSRSSATNNLNGRWFSGIIMTKELRLLHTETKLIHCMKFTCVCPVFSILIWNEILHFRALQYRVISPFYNMMLHFPDATTTRNWKEIYQTLIWDHVQPFERKVHFTRDLSLVQNSSSALYGETSGPKIVSHLERKQRWIYVNSVSMLGMTLMGCR